MKDRIKEIRKDKKLTQTEFGEMIGVKGNTITNYENGLRKPSDAIIMAICKEFDVNEKWLRDGILPKYKEKNRDAKISEYISEIVTGDDEFIKDIIEVYMELDNPSKHVFKDTIYKIAEKHNKRE